MTPGTKDVEFIGFNPEGNKIWKEVKKKKLPKIPAGGPPPPPNFIPEQSQETETVGISNNLFTPDKALKMRRDFVRAGYPTKGSQPPEDFEPDIK
jgi:hypothetical protein